MKNYILQDGCHNCHWKFVKEDWDSPDEYYCTYGDKKARPICGSVFMKERFGDAGDIPEDADDDWWSERGKQLDKEYTAWGEWSKNRGTDRAGICELWQEGEKKE